MYYFAKKILQHFLWPLNWCLISFSFGLFFLYQGKKRRSFLFLLFSFFSLLLFSLPITARLLREPLEFSEPIQTLDSYPRADGIIVLGGSVQGKVPPRLEAEEGGGARCQVAARLFHKKKAPEIIVSDGGSYLDEKNQKRTGSEDLQEVLEAMGVPAKAIIQERKSRTTLENALYTAKIVEERKWKTIFLVTNAFHIRRAKRAFERYFELYFGPGRRISFIAVPTSHEVTWEPISLLEWIPSAAALNSSTISLKEHWGYWVENLVVQNNSLVKY